MPLTKVTGKGISNLDELGVGTSSPATSYGVVTQIHDTGTAGANLRLTDANSGSGTGNGFEIIQLGVNNYLINRENGFISIYNNGYERLRILSGGGLTFNGDTATANALNDYEEGTYDVTMTPGTSGSITVRSDYNTGGYIKIGNLVSVYGYVVVTSTSSPSGYIQVNLPFAVTNTSEGHASAAIYVHIGSLSGKNTNEIGNGLAFNGQSYFRVYSTDGTGYGTSSANALTSSSFMYFGGSYRTG
tara:strand:- start:588 stop:1322 length:735 start_codon:yes stop_codon:yes gene_type:complete